MGITVASERQNTNQEAVKATSIQKDDSIEHMYAQVLKRAEGILKTEQGGLNVKYGQIFNTFLYARVNYLQKVLVKKHGNTIQSGPFSGMSFHEQSTEGCYIPKLLGCYEAELHPIIDELKDIVYQRIIDVGCAEGYYAVGLARVFPTSEIWAFDINPKAQEFTRELAIQNSVSDRISIWGELQREHWPKLLQGRCLIVCDIEGAEYNLLKTDPTIFKKTDLIIELHHTDRSEGEELKGLLESFKETHEIRLLEHGGRNPNQFQALRHWKHIDQWLAIWEFRGMPTPWAILRTKTA